MNEQVIKIDQAAQIMREAMREAIKRHSLWYMIQGILMMLAGLVALIFPLVSSVAIVLLLGWLLIISGVLQGISLIGASNGIRRSRTDGRRFTGPAPAGHRKGRKVRTPKGSAPGNPRSGQPEGKWHRKYTALSERPARPGASRRVRVKRCGKSAPRSR